MKFIGKFLFTLLLLLLLLIVVVYVLLQTRWGAGWVSRWITDNTDYHLSVTKIEHNFSNPSHFILDDFSFGHDGQPAIVVAKRVDLGLALTQFSDPLHFDTITLHEGVLNAANMANRIAWPMRANRLQLNEMAINSPQSALPFSAGQVTGGVIPWKPEVGDLLGNNASFQMSATTMKLDGVVGNNVLIQGRIANNQWVFSNVGADLARGSMTGSAQRDAQGNWNIARLRLTDIRLQTDRTLQDFLKPLMALPSIHIDRMDMTDARLQGPDWAVTDLDLALKDFTLRGEDWQSDGGSLSMNASNFINGRLELNDPILNLSFSPQGIQITQFSSRWVNGLVRAEGNWARQNKRLTLDELMLAGLEYTLPDNWRDRWMQPLPGWLDSVAVTKFSGNRNLVIDINPDFPFQMTALDGNGSNLLMARNHQWGIWSGSLNFNAAEATFNRTDLRHPSIALTADDNQIKVTELSAFTGTGMVESLATLDQAPTRNLALTLNGRSVPANLLHNWGWPAVSLEGDATMQLKLNASLAAGTPLKSTANGTLTINKDQQSVQQTLHNGALQP
ncbi:AsmA family protein [Paramixta manurensis]|uniref:AsmA family protein n=1 Tax=Paramixta manurensis TaxID=2740817 RepID=A0A6M8UVI3_9GAMM|nr:AsmA family protein [Erwiniaceae bacterium PD-1]